MHAHPHYACTQARTCLHAYKHPIPGLHMHAWLAHAHTQSQGTVAMAHSNVDEHDTDANSRMHTCATSMAIHRISLTI